MTLRKSFLLVEALVSVAIFSAGVLGTYRCEEVYKKLTLKSVKLLKETLVAESNLNYLHSLDFDHPCLQNGIHECSSECCAVDEGNYEVIEISQDLKVIKIKFQNLSLERLKVK